MAIDMFAQFEQEFGMYTKQVEAELEAAYTAMYAQAESSMRNLMAELSVKCIMLQYKTSNP